MNKLVMILAMCISPVLAQAQPVSGMVIKIDPVALIKKSAAKYQATFKLNEKTAVAQMDGMLTEQYMAGGRIANEPDAYLKSLYYQASTLLLNGYPIAGGTIVSVARNHPAFVKSGAGQGLAAFVDAMLQPTDADIDLAQMRDRVKSARAALRNLRPDLRFYADLWVVGSIYRDDIAAAAGWSGIDGMRATPAERKLIKQALAR